MRIRQAPDQLIIDNSLAMPVATGVILGLGGIAIGVLGFLNQIRWLYLLALALLAIGALVVAFAKSTHVVLAKAGNSSVAAKTLFGKTQSRTFALTDVTAVQLQTSQTQHRSTDADGSQRYDTEVKSTVYLKTSAAHIIFIGSQTRTLNLGGMLGALIQSAPLQAEAKQIADFIGVPLLVADAMSFDTRANHIG